MVFHIELSIPLVFLAGVLTASPPCVLPIIPPSPRLKGYRLRSLFIIIGTAAFFTSPLKASPGLTDAEHVFLEVEQMNNDVKNKGKGKLQSV